MLWSFKLIDLHKLLAGFYCLMWYSPMNPDLRWQLPVSSECTKNPDGYMRSCFTILLLKGKTMRVFDLFHIYQGTPAVPILNLFRRNWCENVNMQCVEQLILICQNGKTGWPQDDSPDWFLCCVQAKSLLPGTIQWALGTPYLSAFKRFCLLKQSTGNANH